MRCSSALCQEEVPLMPSSLFATCRRSTLQLRNYSILLHRPWESLQLCAKEGPMVGLKEPQCWGMGCVCHPRSMVSSVRSLAWELACIRVLFLAHCSSFWCWRRFRVSSALVYHGSSSMLMPSCSSWTTKMSVSPSSRCGWLAWKIKGPIATWRKPSSWSLVLAMMSFRYLVSITVLSAVVVLAETPSCAHSVCCRSTRCAVA